MRKNNPLSSAVDRPGLVAEGEIITIPFGTATFDSMAPVTPEQLAPTMPTTPSPVIRRSVADVAAAASMQVLSARTGSTMTPSSNMPESETSDIAISAPAAIAGASDSSGPVKPRTTPSLMGLCASAKAAVVASVAAVASKNFLICILTVGDSFSSLGKGGYAASCRDESHDMNGSQIFISAKMGRYREIPCLPAKSTKNCQATRPERDPRVACHSTAWARRSASETVTP